MKYILSCVAAAAAIMILLNPAEIGGAVGGAVRTCLEVMIPSLFAFTVLSVYLQNSGLYRIALKPLTKPLSWILGIDEELCSVFVLGNIGGYPVGARLLSELVRSGRLSRSDGGRLLCCCYGSGPSFVISIVGGQVFGSAAAGGVIFAACFLSSLVIGICVCRGGRRIALSSGVAQYDISSGCLVGSVMAGAKVMFTVCAMITGFSVATAAADITGIMKLSAELFCSMGAGGSSAHILPSLLEISRIQGIVPQGVFAAPLCGALLALGGVCVLLQIAAVTGGALPLKPFLISRLPAMLLSGALSGVAVPWCGEAGEVYIPTSGEIQPQIFSVNAGMSMCVLIMCGILLASCRKSSSQK